MAQWMVWDRRPEGNLKKISIEAALWYEAKEKASRVFRCSPMDLDAEPVEKVSDAP